MTYSLNSQRRLLMAKKLKQFKEKRNKIKQALKIATSKLPMEKKIDLFLENAERQSQKA